MLRTAFFSTAAAASLAAAACPVVAGDQLSGDKAPVEKTATVDPIAGKKLPADCVRVPEDAATIQTAIDLAKDGGTVLVAPGVYHESLTLSGKSVHLASWFLVTQDPRDVLRTVLDGSLPDPDIEDDITPMVDQVILIGPMAGPQTTVLGLTIRDGDDGIACHAQARILHNRFVNNVDGIDFENGGGLCQFNEFVANDDDGVDYDDASHGVVANNVMRDNDDDGMEIRLHPHKGERLVIVVRDNVISGNGENGIQVIDYPELSDRAITIERNIIANNAMAGIGCMADANTREDYQGASIPEPITILNNTIVGNQYGITGGASATVANNIVAGNQHAGLKNIAGKSELSRNLLWANGEAAIGCNLSEGSIIEADPELDAEYRPAATSACIDAGTVRIELTEAEPIGPARFIGRAPDLGAIELK
jgi:hypothetical protein